MSHVVDRPVVVATGRHGRPIACRWDRRWRRVAEVLDEWVYREPWWERSLFEEGTGAAPERAFFRVRLQDGAVVDLQRRSEDGAWRLHRVFD